MKNQSFVATVFITLLLISVAFAPMVGVSQQNVSNVSVETPIEDGALMVKQLPGIVVQENTDLLARILIGQIALTFTTNAQHTEAAAQLEDVVTGEKETLTFTVTKLVRNYLTKVYYSDTLVTAFSTRYDPLERGATDDLSTMSATSSAQQTVHAQAYAYMWDNVYFTKGTGVKYAHPDYTYYHLDPWYDAIIIGKELMHYHMSSTTASILAGLAPLFASVLFGIIFSVGSAIVGAVIPAVLVSIGIPVAGLIVSPIVGAIGSALVGAIGALIGGVLGLVVGSLASAVLLDERGCIWFWTAKEWVWMVFVVPGYFRAAEITLWDYIGMGNP